MSREGACFFFLSGRRRQLFSSPCRLLSRRLEKTELLRWILSNHWAWRQLQVVVAGKRLADHSPEQPGLVKRPNDGHTPASVTELLPPPHLSFDFIPVFHNFTKMPCRQVWELWINSAQFLSKMKTVHTFLAIWKWVVVQSQIFVMVISISSLITSLLLLMLYLVVYSLNSWVHCIVYPLNS